MESSTTTCFAAETVSPVLSKEGDAIQCRIAGSLLPVDDGSPCCGEYFECAIWRTRRALELDSSVQLAHRDAVLSERHRHAMRDGRRDNVSVGFR